jgi:tetratricopeptide (TPR) repeat protein
MQKIKIFLASSQELKVSRDEFEKFIRRKNDSWEPRGISFQLIIWEDFIDAVSKDRKQEDYNKAIRESDILLILVFSKVGIYTREEFEMGYEQFLKTDKPLIYTYFQYPRIDEGNLTREESNSVFDFQDRLQQIGHFKGKFKSSEDLLFQFSEQLDKLFPYSSGNRSEASGFPHLLTNIPKHDDEFIGREEDLKRLEKELETSQKIVLMNGLGGIGKTTLAKKFVQNNLDKYDHVAWIEVKSQDSGHEQNMSVVEAFGYDEVLSHSLGLEFSNESNDLRFKLIIQALSNLKGKNLLVIDNAREDLNNRDIKDILPRPPHWHILITSRNAFSVFKPLAIDILSKKYAKELFQTHYKKTANEADIEELLHEIGYHTLTIELLAKTLNYPGQKLTIKKVIKKIRDKELSAPDLQRKIGLTHNREETEIYIHLIQTFNISPLTENEHWLMKQFCFLLPVSYTIEQLENFLDIQNDEKRKEFHDSLNMLSKKGWLQLNEDNYNIHRIVQQMASYQLQPSLKDVENLIQKFIGLLFINSYTDFTKLFYLVPYAEFILSKLDKNEIKSSLITDLQNNISMVLRILGDYEKAKELSELALKNRIKCSGEHSYKIATLQSNLASVYLDLNELEKAKELLELALENDIKNFGENHPDVAIDQSNLALVYTDLLEYEKAMKLLELALKNGIKNLGNDHPSIAIRQSNLATVYLHLNEPEKAKKLLEKAYKNNIKNFSEDHPNIATNQSNLAIAYSKMGEYQKAEELLEKAYKTNIKFLGKDHPTSKYMWDYLEEIRHLKK